MGTTAATAPGFLHLAAHPVRWLLLTELADSDLRVRELAERLDQPQNLVSYHLRLLRDSGLVTARRSSFDGRDSYHHLDVEQCADALKATGLALHPALRLDLTPGAGVRPDARRPRVLFACTGNSARSPIAAALTGHLTHGRVDATSAGSHPKAQMHPHAVRVLRDEYGIDISHQQPTHLDAVHQRQFDRTVSLCDRVREARPEFRNQPRPTHWSIPDPAATGPSARAGYPAFKRAAAEIETRVRHLLPTLTPADAPESLP